MRLPISTGGHGFTRGCVEGKSRDERVACQKVLVGGFEPATPGWKCIPALFLMLRELTRFVKITKSVTVAPAPGKNNDDVAERSRSGRGRSDRFISA